MSKLLGRHSSHVIMLSLLTPSHRFLLCCGVVHKRNEVNSKFYCFYAFARSVFWGTLLLVCCACRVDSGMGSCRIDAAMSTCAPNFGIVCAFQKQGTPKARFWNKAIGPAQFLCHRRSAEYVLSALLPRELSCLMCGDANGFINETANVTRTIQATIKQIFAYINQHESMYTCSIMRARAQLRSQSVHISTGTTPTESNNNTLPFPVGLQVGDEEQQGRPAVWAAIKCSRKNQRLLEASCAPMPSSEHLLRTSPALTHSPWGKRLILRFRLRILSANK